MRGFAGAVACAAVICGLTGAAPAAAEGLTTRAIGAVLRTQGDVFVSRGGLRTQLPEGARVFMGERLRTRGADARFEMRLIDGARLQVGGDVDMQLNRYLYEPAFAVGEAAIQMFDGVARYRAGAIGADDAILVATPFGDVSASGVDFWMRARESRIEIGVFDQGVLNVKTAAGEVALTEPYSFTVVWSFAEPPKSPLKLSRSAIATLLDALRHDGDAEVLDPDEDPPLGPETPGPDEYAVAPDREDPPAVLLRPLREAREAVFEGEEPDDQPIILDLAPVEDDEDDGFGDDGLAPPPEFDLGGGVTPEAGAVETPMEDGPTDDDLSREAVDARGGDAGEDATAGAVLAPPPEFLGDAPSAPVTSPMSGFDGAVDGVAGAELDRLARPPSSSTTPLTPPIPSTAPSPLAASEPEAAPSTTPNLAPSPPSAAPPVEPDGPAISDALDAFFNSGREGP